MRRSVWPVLFSVMAPSLCVAWGVEGHRVVADVASAHLTPVAARGVADLLTGESEPTLAGIASWADDVRGANPATAPWHFVNFHGDCHFVAERDCAEGQCIVVAIANWAAVLGNASQPAARRLEALKWVTHLAGDIHQPFHVSNGDDKGGNKFQVQFAGRGTNLHHLWDTELVRGIGTNPVADRGTPVRFSSPAEFAPTKWAEDGCAKVAANHLYPDSHVVADSYVAANRPLVAHQLQIAGERLAAIINAELDP
jgi:hypothetical protein